MLFVDLRNQSDNVTPPSGYSAPLEWRIEFVRKEVGGNACNKSIWYDPDTAKVYHCSNSYYTRNCSNWTKANYSAVYKNDIIATYNENTADW